MEECGSTSRRSVIDMAAILTLRIDMKLSGRLTLIPDSQKVFGAFMSMYAEHTSPEKATELVAKIKDGRVYFALSNALPNASPNASPTGYLPVPHTALLDRLAEAGTKDDGIKEAKAKYEAVKKRHYAKIEQIEKMLEDPARAKDVYPYVSIANTQQVHTSIAYDVPGLNPYLYSVPEIVVTEISRPASDDGKDNARIIQDFSFYLSFEKCDECKALTRAFAEARKSGRLFFLGPRASQGLNLFTLQGMYPADIPSDEHAERYLNLGMLLPGEIDCGKSALKLFTSERRPFEQRGGWDSACEKKFISFIDAGSILYPTRGIKLAGRSINSPFDDKAIVFGNAFLYPIQTQLGDVSREKL